MEYIAVITSKDVICYFLPRVILSKTITNNRESPDKRSAAKDERCSASDKRPETRVDCRRSVS